MKIKVKICGITDHKDASAAVRLGADALGFIFASSPRQVSPEKAQEIIRAVPPFVKTVGVFVNESLDVIRELRESCGFDLVQLHGDEPPDLCKELMPRAIKALRIKDGSSLQAIDTYRGKIRALLLDTYSRDMIGGTGKNFDWELAIKAKELGMPVILAGGLNPSNIEKAISVVQPYAVDVNSGVEERPGRKNHALMKELMEKVNKFNLGELADD